VVRECDTCAQPYEAKRSTSRYCSDLCRKRSQRGTGESSGTYAALSAELDAAGVLGTGKASIVLALAEAMDSPSASASGKAALARELAAAMDRALADVKVADDPLDELSRLRDRKRGSA